jgi:8-oxo-dGTP diphosphatase
MIKVFFIRHAKAGERERWTDPDHLRPLTKPGFKQADALVGLLADDDIARVLSSYYVRCVQTVEPLAHARGLKVEDHDALVEGAFTGDALALIQEAPEPTALCTHGDVMENVVGHLQDAGVDGADRSLAKKGSTWVLSVDRGRVVRAAYLAPPT